MREMTMVTEPYETARPTVRCTHFLFGPTARYRDAKYPGLPRFRECYGAWKLQITCDQEDRVKLLHEIIGRIFPEEWARAYGMGAKDLLCVSGTVEGDGPVVAIYEPCEAAEAEVQVAQAR